MTVPAKLLHESRSAHDAYRRLAAVKAPGLAKQDQIRKALTLRERAHEADPEHADPAWGEDKAPHGELVAFYRQALGVSL